jgi:hypothetical protein
MLVTGKETKDLRPLVMLLGDDASGWQNQVKRELGQVVGGLVVPDRGSLMDQAREWATVADRLDLVIYWLEPAKAEDELYLGLAFGRKFATIIGLHPSLTNQQAISDVLTMLARSIGCLLRIYNGLPDTIVAAKNLLQGAPF